MNSNQKIVRYKNDMLKLNIAALDSTELKLFMAICSDLKDQGTNDVDFTFQELRILAGITDKYGKDFLKMLDSISNTLMNVIYCEYTPTKANGLFNFSKKCFFTSFDVDAEDELVTVSVHPDMAYMLNDWKGGQWSQFALDIFNSIHSFGSKQLFRILLQDSNCKKAYISMDEAKLIMGCSNQRNDIFYNRTLQSSMNHFEKLGIILPGWKIEKTVRNNIPDTLMFTYKMRNEIKMLNTNKTKKKNADPFFEGQLSLLKQLGKSDAYIKCFEETGDIGKADMLYHFRQRHGDNIDYEEIQEVNNNSINEDEDELPFF